MQKIKEFDAFLTKFKSTQYWQQMQNTVEDSPWHREANVAVHTEMAMQQFRDRFIKSYNEVEAVIGLTALLFHDIGKPVAEEVLEKKDGSGEKYRRYAGHEQDSAVTFQECYLTMPELRALLSEQEARAVRWIIEHHLPYGYKDKQKRQGLAIATRRALDAVNANYSLFFSCLRSDAAGRISDGHAEKLQDVERWIAEFVKIDTEPTALRTGNTMYLLIGPSGSGKTTWTRKRLKSTDSVISYDDYKMRFWVLQNGDVKSNMSDADTYDMVWAYANEHETEFNKFANEQIMNAVDYASKHGGNVFVDTVNASKKRRVKFTELAKQKKFRVVAVEFWNSLQTLADRQKTRGDKVVPYGSVLQQLHAIGAAWDGAEVDSVIMEVGQ